MPAITAVVSPIGSPDGVPRVVWSPLAPGDTGVPYLVKNRYGFVGSIQISGTFGGATIALEQSNDGTTWFPATDTLGNAISATTAEISEMSLAAAYLRPTITGGTGSAIDVIIVFRG
jgi:hypothetical protein